jgi:competence protein ComGC
MKTSYFIKKQPGFGLLELMLAAMIASGITLGYLYNQSRQSAINQSQSQAGYYQMVSDAVSKYMANNYNQLKAISKPKTCADPQLFTEAKAATASTGCTIQATFLSGTSTSPVSNGLQPTLAELKNTGYLDANFSNSFLWPTQPTMYAAATAAAGSTYADSEYRVQIQAWCNGAAPTTDTVCDKPVLHSLVYNAQPFAANTVNGFINYSRFDRLLEARTSLGANAFISYEWALKKDDLLYSEGDKNQLPNVLKYSGGSDAGKGVEGVLALQATYMPMQVSSSPTPPPPPPPVPPTPYPSQKPYTACDASQENQIAIASSNAIRLMPYSASGPPLRCSSTTSYTLETNPGHSRGALKNVAAIKNDVLVCKKNEPVHHFAESMNYPCPIPPSWKTCVTVVKAGKLNASYMSSSVIVQGTTFPGYPWILGSPDNDEGDYCWQPVIEIYKLDFGSSGAIGLGPETITKSRPGMGFCLPNEEGCYKFKYLAKGRWYE